MWMVDPKIMCQKHLCGEHVECHMFIGSIKAGTSMSGYVAKNLLESTSLQERHDLLSQEMKNRKYNHNSPLLVTENILNNIPTEQRSITINRDEALKDLLSRCPICRKRFEELYGKDSNQGTS